jgi:hypothetical protein
MRVEKQKLPKSCRNNLDPYDRVLSLQLAHDEFSGLEYICYLLNNPQFDDKNELRQQSYVIKRIVEDISKQPPSKMSWTESGFKYESFPLGQQFKPSIDSPLHFFNQEARQNPITLKFIGSKKKGSTKRRIELYPTVDGSPAGMALWVLWQEYFKKEGWKRLKKCPQCKLWFVDRTRNKKKERCSSDCTWKWWSWGRRKAEGHKLPKTKIRKSQISKKRGAVHG